MAHVELSDSGLAAALPVTAHDEYGRPVEKAVAAERPLTVYLDKYEIVTLMTLGTQPELLTLGYLRNQGLVDDIAEIDAVQVDWEVEAAAVVTRHGTDPDRLAVLGKRTVTTGCGQGTVYGQLQQRLERIRLQPPPVRQSVLYRLLANLKAYNEVYKQAGAVHGCALCSREGEILFFCEDVGRHNAVDAIAGYMWLNGIDGGDKIFYTTGRLTSEMSIKAAQMGIPVLLSRSGVTQMGLEMARRAGIVLIARARGHHFLVYNGREQLVYDAPPRRSA
ncbi:FdhD protein [Methylomarinovum caldicuralii]|uniref:Sulfur carrier protein FdhD n=1 Tax=Methylomarinovum caldicuralii TaxID=438856 RepID=A0AAU9BZL8_9GAMM|nr:formate dehydrogenase accessory sulfurtransferase FdhD [Methylomarinovum caldicuralii]BCX81512.1 FdhD protein [Methylomarinovum caldicuralii]